MKLETTEGKRVLTVDDHPSSPGTEMELVDEKIEAYKLELEQTIDSFNMLESKGIKNKNNDIMKARFEAKLQELNNLIT